MAVSTMTAPDVEPRQRLTKWLIGMASVVMLVGLLFGYDQGVIGGVLDGIKQSFDIATFAIEVITSWVTLGALVGALVAGGLADKIGRRQTIILAGVLFTAGAAIEAFAPGTFILVVGRLTVGFGVGVASVAAPQYAAEMAPTRLRGRFVSMYQLAITIGIFIAYLIDSWLASEDRWRVMLGLSAVPALLLVLAMLPLPDSPNWYLKVGRADDARKTLREAQPDGDVDTEVAEIQASLGERQVPWSAVFAKRWRAPLVLGVGLAVFQQLTGINAVIYYSDRIFAAAGFNTPQAQTAATTWAIGAVNVLATFIAIAFVGPSRAAPVALHRPDRHWLGPGDDRFLLRQAWRHHRPQHHDRQRPERRRRRDAHRDGGLHRQLRVLPRPGRLDRDQRDLPERGPRPRRRRRHGGQLGLGLVGDAVLPDPDGHHWRGGDVLPLRPDVRRRVHLHLVPAPGDPGAFAGPDPADVGGPVQRSSHTPQTEEVA